MLEIVPVRNEADLGEVRTLFREYADSLGVDLSFQDFEREYADLPGEYVPPRGELLLGRWDGAAAGCIALRPLRGEGIAGSVALRPNEGELCEMKRLYLRDAFRGRGIGRALADGIVVAARARGYTRMR